MSDTLSATPGTTKQYTSHDTATGVVLVGRLGGQQPHLRRQLRLHVQDLLAGADQLLGEEIGKTGCVLDRLVRCGNASAHFRRRSSCLGPDRTRSSARLRSPLSTATAVCDPLCGSTPIITVIASSFVVA
jgi:hypothetical protein